MMKDPFIALLFSDEVGMITIAVAIIIIIPLLIKLLYHIIMICFYVAAGVVKLTRWLWKRYGNEIKKWYHEDFLGLFESRKNKHKAV